VSINLKSERYTALLESDTVEIPTEAKAPPPGTYQLTVVVRDSSGWIAARTVDLTVKHGERPASHRDGRGAPLARRDDREYREYLREEQRSQRGCIACRMQLAFHHGLLDLRHYSFSPAHTRGDVGCPP
jgi:hypothetical protein